MQRFAEIARRRPEDLDLASAALLIGAAGTGLGSGDVSIWLAELDAYALGVRGLPGLRERLFTELGFQGDTRTYYRPANSFLQSVMSRRLGIPITLSLLTIEVGRRAGVALHPVGMPGHFLVGVPGDPSHFLDPFGGGTMLDLAGCEARFRQSTGAGPAVPFGPHLLPAVGPHEVLIRMLANLAAGYERERSGKDLEWVARMRLALPRVSPAEIMALATALEWQGRFADAARVLEQPGVDGVDPDGELRRAARGLRARNN